MIENRDIFVCWYRDHESKSTLDSDNIDLDCENLVRQINTVLPDKFKALVCTTPNGSWVGIVTTDILGTYINKYPHDKYPSPKWRKWDKYHVANISFAYDFSQKPSPINLHITVYKKEALCLFDYIVPILEKKASELREIWLCSEKYHHLTLWEKIVKWLSWWKKE